MPAKKTAKKLDDIFERARPYQSLKTDFIPDIGDPFWSEFCQPLLVFLLQQDRKWKEVDAWARKRKINSYFLRNALAWLEENKYAETYLPEGVETSQGAWVWRASDVDRTKEYAKNGK